MHYSAIVSPKFLDQLESEIRLFETAIYPHDDGTKYVCHHGDIPEARLAEILTLTRADVLDREDDQSVLSLNEYFNERNQDMPSARRTIHLWGGGIKFKSNK